MERIKRQVGDLAQQNGAYKSRLTLKKQLLLEKKQEMRLDFKIDHHDVVGLVCLATFVHKS
jgi:hypothetical protein